MHKLDSISPGIANAENLLYYPEIKTRSLKFKLGPDFKTSLDNLYLIGNCSGQVGDIMRSAVMGYILGKQLMD